MNMFVSFVLTSLILFCGYPGCFRFYWFSWVCFTIFSFV